MKYHGDICFAFTEETAPGVWEEKVVTRHYRGDLIHRSSKYAQASRVNDDIQISNEISIIVDKFAMDNFYHMRWIEFAGAKWKIESVDFQYPRLIIKTGGLYNA